MVGVRCNTHLLHNQSCRNDDCRVGAFLVAGPTASSSPGGHHLRMATTAADEGSSINYSQNTTEREIFVGASVVVDLEAAENDNTTCTYSSTASNREVCGSHPNLTFNPPSVVVENVVDGSEEFFDASQTMIEASPMEDRLTLGAKRCKVVLATLMVVIFVSAELTTVGLPAQ